MRLIANAIEYPDTQANTEVSFVEEENC